MFFWSCYFWRFVRAFFQMEWEKISIYFGLCESSRSGNKRNIESAVLAVVKMKILKISKWISRAFQLGSLEGPSKFTLKRIHGCIPRKIFEFKAFTLFKMGISTCCFPFSNAFWFYSMPSNDIWFKKELGWIYSLCGNLVLRRNEIFKPWSVKVLPDR